MEQVKQGLSVFSLDFLNNLQVLPDEEEKTEAEMLEEKKQIELKEKQKWCESKESGIPIRFQQSSFENYIAKTDEEKKNLEVCKNFVAGKSRQMLMFIGKYGNGKTHLGASIIREFEKRGRFTTSFEICTRYEMGSDFKAEENRWEVLERFCNYEVLVIDEFGRAKPEVERLIIPYLINARYENKKKTVIITNLEKDKVIDLLGEASVDRLREVCSTIVFTEESKRGAL